MFSLFEKKDSRTIEESLSRLRLDKHEEEALHIIFPNDDKKIEQNVYSLKTIKQRNKSKRINWKVGYFEKEENIAKSVIVQAIDDGIISDDIFYDFLIEIEKLKKERIEKNTLSDIKKETLNIEYKLKIINLRSRKIEIEESFNSFGKLIFNMKAFIFEEV